MRIKTGRLRLCSILIMTLLLGGQPLRAGVMEVSAAEPASAGWYNDNPEAKAFFIGTAGQLAYLAELVNSGVGFQGKTITLTGDIDLSGIENWVPVGMTRSVSFKGTFDGAGHVIQNLTLNRPEENYVGLFGYLNGASVKNLEIAGGNVTGGTYVGGITANAYASTIENCGNAASISAESQAGGIAGVALGGVRITGCRNGGAVSGESSCGGIVGRMTGGDTDNKGRVTDCSNTGEITGTKGSAGGIAGTASSITIETSWNRGPVKGGEKVGGIVGNSLTSSAHISGRSTENGATVLNCCNAGNIEGTADVAGIVGSTSTHEEAGPTIISNCYNLPAMDYPIAIRAEISNSYYLKAKDTADLPEKDTAEAAVKVAPKPAAAFNSGEVAWRLNMNEETHSGLWGLGRAEFGFEGLENVPVLADAEHPAVYRVELINREKGETAPGEVVSVEGEYMAQGSKVTLEGILKEDFQGYIMRIEDIDPETLAVNTERQFTMPGRNVKIGYILMPGSLPESQSEKDEKLVGREENSAAGNQLEESPPDQEKEKPSSPPQPRRRLYEITDEVEVREESTVNLFLTVIIGLSASAIVLLAALERYIIYRKSTG